MTDEQIRNLPRPRVLSDGITPKHERDCRLMAERGDETQATILAEYETSLYFHTVPFGQWREHFRVK